MATATFAHNNAAIFKIGVGTSTTTVSGRAGLARGNTDAELEFFFTGTGFTLPYYAQTATGIYYYLDGVKVSPTLTTGAWTDLVVTGLTEGVHRLVLKAGGGATSYYDATNFITIEGAAPAISSVNYQAPTFLSTSTANLIYTAASFSTSPYNYLSLDAYDASLRLKVDFTGVTELWVWMKTTNATTRWAIFIDGAFFSLYTNTVTTGVWQWSQVLSGLSLTGAHDVEIHAYTGESSTGLSYLSGLRFVAATPPGTVPTRTAPTPYALRVGFLGDSITQAHRPNQVNGEFPGLAYNLSLRFGWGEYNRSRGGTGITHLRDTQFPLVSSLAPALDRLIAMTGINDISAQTTTTTTALYRTAWDSTLTAMASSAIPRVDIIKILPGFSRTATQIAPWNAEIVNAVNANGNSKFRVLDLSTGPGGNFDVSLHTHDGTHLNEAGYMLFTTNYLALSGDLTVAIGRQLKRIKTGGQLTGYMQTGGLL